MTQQTQISLSSNVASLCLGLTSFFHPPGRSKTVAKNVKCIGEKWPKEVRVLSEKWSIHRYGLLSGGKSVLRSA